MNINYRIGLWLWLVYAPLLAKAQGSYRIGSMPAINFNQKIAADWGLNFKWESRQRWQEGDLDATPERSFDLVLNDFSLVGSRRLGLHSKLAAGYLIRFREGTQFHRSMQQWTFVRQSGAIRYAHRMATDQTFAQGQAPTWRARYRLNLELPLNGTRLDFGEWYLKAGPELLQIYSAGVYELELRLVPQLGLVFKNDNKVEAGIDYRMKSILLNDSEHELWFRISWFSRLSFIQ